MISLGAKLRELLLHAGVRRTLLSYGTLLAALYVARILLERYRDEAAASLARFTPFLDAATIHAVLMAVLRAAIVCLIFALIVRGIQALHRWCVAQVDGWSRAAASLPVGGFGNLDRDDIAPWVLAVLRLARAISLLLVTITFLPFLLAAFPGTASYAEATIAYVVEAATEIGRDIVDYLPNLIYLSLLILLARYLLKLLHYFASAINRGKIVLPGFLPDWADPTYKLVRALVLIFTLVVSYPYLPASQSEFFKGFSVFLGALLTLGSTAAIGNIVSGVVMTYTRAFTVGDRVRIGSTTGAVLEKSLFVTRIRTLENEEVTIPNGIVLGGPITNFTTASAAGGLVLTVSVGIGYDVAWRRVHELLVQAASNTNGVISDPPSSVWQKALGDYAVNYELRAYTDRPDEMGRILSDLRRNVLDAFHEGGVEIMTPAVTAYRRSEQTVVPPAE